ncbi:MAG: hypothetical protein AAFX81_00375 [Pseudomonadota bacterium]
MSSTTCFSVHAEPSPHVMSRVFDLLARHGVLPSQCHSQHVPSRSLVIDLHLADLDGTLTQKLHDGLRRLVEVEDVLVGAKCAPA